MSTRRQRGPALACKRALDCATAVAVAAAVAPLAPALGLLLWAVQGRPLLFCQQRIGRDGRPFTCRKLRTMRPAAAGETPGTADAARTGRLGRALRASGLDELPQLLNILRGEMSWIGPRPLPVAYLPRYSAEQARRHAVLPGLTGWAQVHGRNGLGWEARLALDAEYAATWSLGLDARVLVRTLGQLARPRQAWARGGAGMPEFTGGAPCPR